MADKPKIDPEAWWRDPMADALNHFFRSQNEDFPSEPYGGECDKDTMALMQLELLLQAKLLRKLMRQGYEFSPMVLALAEVVAAAQEHIQGQAIAALSA